MLKKIAFFFSLLAIVEAFAQEKFAYLDFSEIIKIMPEYIQMQDSIKKTQIAMQNEMGILQEEYKKKYESFMNESSNLIESIKIRRMKEIEDMEERVGIFHEQSQKQLQKTYEQLLAPIQQKVQKAIKTVGEEHNFTYILEKAGFLYISPSAINATSFVKQKLGLK